MNSSLLFLYHTIYLKRLLPKFFERSEVAILQLFFPLWKAVHNPLLSSGPLTDIPQKKTWTLKMHPWKKENHLQTTNSLVSTVNFQGLYGIFPAISRPQFLNFSWRVKLLFFSHFVECLHVFHQGIRWFPKWPKMRYTNCCTKISLECCDPFWLDHCVAFSIDIPWKKCFLAELLVFWDMKEDPIYW